MIIQDIYNKLCSTSVDNNILKGHKLSATIENNNCNGVGDPWNCDFSPFNELFMDAMQH